jgi:hypothetical protein
MPGSVFVDVGLNAAKSVAIRVGMRRSARPGASAT